jgi:hypothetical protein
MDVDGTVQRIAEERVRDIVLRPAPDRWLSVSVVIDASASMAVWRSTARKFAELLDQMGAFRRLQVWHWRIEEPGSGVSPGTWAPGTAAAPHRAEEVIDTSGPQVVLVVTDCIAAPWYDGRAANVIQKWARHAHVALVSPLPEGCWDRTALTEDGAVALTGRVAAAPNARLAATRAEDGAPVPPADESTLKVPVVSLRSLPLGRWAALATGTPGVAAVGQVFPLRPAAESIPAPEPVLEGDAALERFWGIASPTARKLARFLAAVPVIGLPVIRLVRQELLKDEGEQVHEAEVLLGGLLQVHAKPPGPPDPERTVYEFVPGVRELLLDSLPAVEAVEVHRRVSEYLEKNWGQGSGFSGVVADEGGTAVAMTAEALGSVRVDVLRRAGVPVSSGTGVTVRPQLAPIRVLLLAGLQFSEAYRSPSLPIRNSLVETVRRLANNGQKPDLVAVAGDVTRNGQPEEYREAAAWLSGALLPALAPFDPANVFIVPGNHDLRTGVAVTLPPVEDPLQLQKALAEAWQRIHRTSLRTAYRPFTEFTEEYRVFGFDPDAQASVIDVRGLRVGVVCLASAWSRLVRFGEERLTRFIGRRQLESALQRVRDADVRFVVVHHPIVRLEEPDRSEVMELLERENCRLVFHGPYLSELDVATEVTVHNAPWRGLEVGAGQLHSTDDLVPPVPYFALAEIEPGTGRVSVHPFRWAGVSTGWVSAATGTGADRWQFTLGSLLAKRNEASPPPVPPVTPPGPAEPPRPKSPTSLTGPQFRELRDLLLRLYNRAELERLVRLKLDIDLFTEVAADNPLDVVMLELLRYLDRRGRVDELLDAVVGDRPRNQEIRRLRAKLGSEPVPAETAPPPLRLTGREVGELVGHLTQWFNPERLEYLTQRIGINLAREVTNPQQPLDVVATELVTYLNRRDRIVNLIDAVLMVRPQDANLVGYLNSLRTRSSPALTTESPPVPLELTPSQTEELINLLTKWFRVHDLERLLRS